MPCCGVRRARPWVAWRKSYPSPNSSQRRRKTLSTASSLQPTSSHERVTRSLSDAFTGKFYYGYVSTKYVCLYFAPQCPYPSPPPLRYVGGMGSSQHLHTSVSILLALSKDAASPQVQVWALHALALIADTGGPMFREEGSSIHPAKVEALVYSELTNLFSLVVCKHVSETISKRPMKLRA